MNNSELQSYLCEYKNILKKCKNEKEAVMKAASKVQVKEENSNKLLVYVGTYKVEKHISGAMESLTYDDDPKAKYKRYIDVETGALHNVNMENVKEFEEQYNVIYRDVVMNNLLLHHQNYSDVRNEFFEGILSEPQEKVVLKFTKKDQE